MKQTKKKTRNCSKNLNFYDTLKFKQIIQTLEIDFMGFSKFEQERNLKV